MVKANQVNYAHNPKNVPHKGLGDTVQMLEVVENF